MSALYKREKGYKPPSTYVLDPLEFTTMGLQVRKKRDGEHRWMRMVNERFQHPDSMKTSCVAFGAIIYVHMFPERSAPGMTPPEEWKKEAGITEATLFETKQILEEMDPEYGAKRDFREELNRQMDGDE